MAVPGHLNLIHRQIICDIFIPEIKARFRQPLANGQCFILAAGGSAAPGDAIRRYLDGKTICHVLYRRRQISDAEHGAVVGGFFQRYRVGLVEEGDGGLHIPGDSSVIDRAGQVVSFVSLTADGNRTVFLGGYLLRPGFSVSCNGQCNSGLRCTLHQQTVCCERAAIGLVGGFFQRAGPGRTAVGERNRRIGSNALVIDGDTQRAVGIALRERSYRAARQIGVFPNGDAATISIIRNLI